MKRVLILSVVLTFTTSISAEELPPGIVIPVMLTSGLDSSKAKPGQRLNGKVMETVLMSLGHSIPKGAKVSGHVTQVTQPTDTSPALLAVQFDSIIFGSRQFRLNARVHALASMMAVYDAQVPFFEPDSTPRNSVMLALVGGDAAFRPDNPEKSPERLRFSGELPPGCGRRIDQNGWTGGALWVFSPYACGVYGFGKGLVIINDGSSALPGNIVLASEKKVAVNAGSGWLLQIRASTSAASRERRN